MLKGGWFLFFAFGGLAYAQDKPVVLHNDLVLVCDESGCRERLEKDTNHQGNGTGKQESATEESQQPEPTPDTFITYSPSTDAPSERAEDRAEEDLDAQQSMAVWTNAMFWATMFGVSLIGWTLWETRRAAKFAADTLAEAKNTTNAAVRSIAVTREIGVAQSRAYLSITGGEAELDIALPMVLTIRMNVHNTGNSPATDIKIYAEACFEDRDEEGGVYRFAASGLTVDEVGAQIKYPRELAINGFDAGKLNPLLKNQGGIGVHGRIEYRHVFLKVNEPPIIATFALSGHIDGKKSKWGEESVTTPLNTCAHRRWTKT